MTFEEWWDTHTKGIDSSTLSTDEYNSFLDQKVAALHAWNAGLKEGNVESEKNIEWAQTNHKLVALYRNRNNVICTGLAECKVYNSNVHLSYEFESQAWEVKALINNIMKECVKEIVGSKV